MASPPITLTIAGSDPSGGAGIQADLKTFSALGAFGTSVITALTAQSTRGVTGIHVVPTAFVREQFETLAADVRIDAIKIGMLADAAVTDEVTTLLTAFQQARAARGEAPAPVVLDPVMVATSGDVLLDPESMASLKRLIALADVITPNLPEAAALLGTDEADSLATMRAQAGALRELGAPGVLLKGGHLLTGEESVATDVFADADGLTELTGPVVRTRHTHGTGCSLSSALAALRLQRTDWRTTAADAKEWLTAALGRADELGVGEGHGPVHHFHAWWPSRGGTR